LPHEERKADHSLQEPHKSKMAEKVAQGIQQRVEKVKLDMSIKNHDQ